MDFMVMVRRAEPSRLAAEEVGVWMAVEQVEMLSWVGD
jgi:hypothetical protein